MNSLGRLGIKEVDISSLSLLKFSSLAPDLFYPVDYAVRVMEEKYP